MMRRVLLLAAALLLVGAPAGAATNYVRYVDVDSAGGDCTTAALSGANAACTSLLAAEALGGSGSNPPLDLTAAGDTYRIICGSNSPTTHTADAMAAIAGWTTSETSYLQVETDAASRAGRAWSASKYRISDATGSALDITSLAHGHVFGLQMEVTIDNSSTGVVRLYQATDATHELDFRNLFIRATGQGASAESPAIKYQSNYAGSVLKVINSVLLCQGGRTYYNIVVNSGSAGSAINLYNTLLYSRTGYPTYVPSGQTWNCKNTYAYCSVGDAYYGGGGTLNLTDAASNDLTGSVGHRSVAWSTTNFENVTAGSEDLMLKSGSNLTDGGTDLSAEGYSDDIAGTTRPYGSAWDIGPLEYSVASAPTGMPWLPVLLRHQELIR